jgi:hypothetical protein
VRGEHGGEDRGIARRHCAVVSRTAVVWAHGDHYRENLGTRNGFEALRALVVGAGQPFGTHGGPRACIRCRTNSTRPAIVRNRVERRRESLGRTSLEGASPTSSRSCGAARRCLAIPSVD